MIYPEFEQISYVSSVYSFGKNSYDDSVYSMSTSPNIALVTFEESDDIYSNFSWREETAECWIDMRIGNYLYTFMAKTNLVQGLKAYTLFLKIGPQFRITYEEWNLITTFHGGIRFAELMTIRANVRGKRLVDTYYHETNSLVHWHRCWHCLKPYRQKHQLVGFKHSHSCGALLCIKCKEFESDYIDIWSAYLKTYSPMMDIHMDVIHQGVFDIGATERKFSELADQMQVIVERSDATLDELTDLLRGLASSVGCQVKMVASAWTILAAIAIFETVLSFFLSRREKPEESEDVGEHQAYNPQDNMSYFQKAAELVDSLIELPWKFMDFVKSRWSTLLKIGKDLYSFKQGLTGLDFFATKCGEILQDFLKWATGKQIFLTENARQKHVRVVEMTAAMNTLRTFLDTEVATMLASRIRTEAFLTTHCFVSRFVDDYRGDKDSRVRSLVTVGETILRSTAPIHRALFEEEHPSLQYHPYGVALCGVPGVGKSFLVDRINEAICAKIKENFGQFVPESARLYSKNEADQYWPGYAWQFGILIDDLGQNKQSELPAQLIQLYGDNKVHLNMASLGDKGRSFGSRLIYTTMNGDGFPRPNGLTTAAALWRRRNVLFDVRVNRTYTSGGKPDLDYGAEDDFWMFTQKDVDTGEVLGEIDSFESLVDKIYIDFIRNHERRYGVNKLFPLVRHGGDNYLAQRDHLLVIDPFKSDHFYLLRPKSYELIKEEGVGVTVVTDALPDQETRTLMEVFGSSLPTLDKISVGFEEFYDRVGTFFQKRNYSIIGAEMKDGHYVMTDSPATEESTLLGYLKIAGVVLSGLLVSGILYTIIKGIWNYFSPKHQSAVAKGKVQLVRARPLTLNPKLVHQASGLVDEGGARVLKKIFGNLVSLSPVGTVLDHRIFGLFLGDHKLLVNRHVMKIFPQGQVRCAMALDLSNVWNMTLDFGKRFEYGDSDLLVFDLIGQNFQPFPDVRKHIVGEGDNLPQPGVGLFARVIDGTVEYETIPFEAIEGFRGPDGCHPYYTYRINTQAGQCGLPLFGLLQDKRVKVIGIHSLGVPRGGLGMSVPLTTELFDRFKMIFPDLEFQGVFKEDVQPRTPFPTGLTILGTMKKPIFMNTKTGFQKSPLYGKFGQVEEAPSVITWNDSKDRGNGEFPGLYGIQSYIYDAVDFDPREIEDCARDVGEFLAGFPDRDLYARILTNEEMVNGTNLPHLGHFDMTTSPGYPWKDMRTQKGKYDFFDVVGSDIVWSDTDKARSLQEAIKHREEKAILGERVESYWIDNLKDEILPLPKVQGSKTRVFVNGPLDHTLLCRKYMGGFLAHTMRNRVQNFTGPGIIESGPDWDLLYRKLRSIGNNIIDGDHKTWDKHLSAALMWATRVSMDIFYGGEGSRVREVLLHEVIWTICVMGDVVYVKRAGNVSGCYGTTSIINNVSHLILLTYMWRRIMRQRGCLDLLSWSKMTENLYMNVFGDDHILSVSDRCKSYFNMETLEKEFAKFNMIYTTSRKGSIGAPFSTMETATYLKRTFVMYKGKCLGIRTVPEILSILNWMRFGDMKELMGMSCTMVCLEMWKHGKETYDYWIDKIRLALREIGLFLHFPNWERMEELWDLKTSLVSLGGDMDDMVCSFEVATLGLPMSSEDSRLLGGPIQSLVC